MVLTFRTSSSGNHQDELKCGRVRLLKYKAKNWEEESILFEYVVLQLLSFLEWEILMGMPLALTWIAKVLSQDRGMAKVEPFQCLWVDLLVSLRQVYAAGSSISFWRLFMIQVYLKLWFNLVKIIFWRLFLRVSSFFNI